MQFTDHHTRLKPMWGGAVIVVACIAQINNERYAIEYYRDPISGDVRDVTCMGKAEGDTTEHTLTPEAVADLVRDELDG